MGVEIYFVNQSTLHYIISTLNSSLSTLILSMLENTSTEQLRIVLRFVQVRLKILHDLHGIQPRAFAAQMAVDEEKVNAGHQGILYL